ncbi:MAG: hypothetical protein ACRD3H_15060 [Terriglobales bacterium]
MASTKLTPLNSTFIGSPSATFVDEIQALRNSSTQGPVTLPSSFKATELESRCTVIRSTHRI